MFHVKQESQIKRSGRMLFHVKQFSFDRRQHR